METNAVIRLPSARVDHDRVVTALAAYEVGGEIGRGRYGVVLAGRHRRLGRPVAIKQLPRAFCADPCVRARFIAEAQALAGLHHPHIVKIYDFVESEGLCLLVMERLTGGTVGSRFHAGRFTPDVACAILLAVCAGLHHAHQHGALHREVKPEALMFSGDGTLKVTDLGIAEFIGRSTTQMTNLYAAGTLLYELLAGRLPFPAGSDRHVHESLPPLQEVAPAVPTELASVADRALSRWTSDRYESAEGFGMDIARAAARIWGRGWLARTGVPVWASPAILDGTVQEPATAAAPRAAGLAPAA